MPGFVIAAIIVFGGIWLIRKAARTPPKQMRSYNRKLGGIGLIVLAAYLFVRGNNMFAIPALLAGLTMIGISHPWAQNFDWSAAKGGKSSTVVTSLLSMTLDHVSGRMDGEVIGGSLKGRKLAALSPGEIQTLMNECGGAGDQSQMLLEAWLDRNRASWRNASGAARKSGAMSRDEAYAVLGLKSGATAEEIKQSHKRLMKDFHPDLGGSDYLAAKINQAKDVLLG